jgi:hypothetical protein
VVEGVPTLSAEDLRSISRDLVENARVLYPGVPTASLIPQIAEMAEPDFLAQLDAMLRVRHFIQTDKTMKRDEWAKERARELEADWLFPAIRQNVANLPKRVDLGNGRKKQRGKLCYEDLKLRLRLLEQKSRKRLKQNTEAVAIRSLMKTWPPRSKKAQGITLGEIDVVKARGAGLIA